MGFIEIINIIMQILAFIAGLFQPKMGVRQVAFITHFDCDDVEWTVPAGLNGGEFQGTAQVRCEFEGKGGAGIQGLRRHLLQQLPKDGANGYAVKVSQYQGLPSFAFPTALEMGDSATAHGTTQVATNGSTVLRNVFESDRVTAQGEGKYLQGVYAEYDVRTTDESGVYEIRAVQSMRVKKPMFASGSQFVSKLKSQSEETLRDRAAAAIQEMARHL